MEIWTEAHIREALGLIKAQVSDDCSWEVKDHSYEVKDKMSALCSEDISKWQHNCLCLYRPRGHAKTWDNSS